MTPEIEVVAPSWAELDRIYREQRADHAEALGRPYKRTWRAKDVKPPPGVLDAADVENG